METCGKCRHFCRAKENVKDLCGAWEQPLSPKELRAVFICLKRVPTRKLTYWQITKRPNMSL